MEKSFVSKRSKGRFGPDLDCFFQPAIPKALAMGTFYRWENSLKTFCGQLISRVCVDWPEQLKHGGNIYGSNQFRLKMAFPNSLWSTNAQVRICFHGEVGINDGVGLVSRITGSM